MFDHNVTQYQRHELVRAAQIDKIVRTASADAPGENLTISFVAGSPPPRSGVSPELFINNRKPLNGWWLIESADGALETMPPDQFEIVFTTVNLKLAKS